MADPVDRADQEADAYRNAALARRAKEGPQATGQCLCCGTALAHGLRWCDKLCRDDWELDEQLKAIGG